MLTNAKIDFVLSSKFIMACVSLSRTKTIEMVAIDLQYAYNQAFGFRATLLSEPENAVEVLASDVQRALDIYQRRTANQDALSTTYRWVRDDASLLIEPTPESAWVKFVTYIKSNNLKSAFGNMTGTEVKAVFDHIYKTIKIRDSLHCL